MVNMKRFLFAATSVLVCMGTPNTARGVAGPADVVQEEAHAAIVEVPVFAMDKNGNPVLDLKPEEITVYEDGKKQSVLFVHPVVAGTPLQAVAPGPAAVPTLPPAVQEVRTPRHFVLLFDLTFNELGGIKRAREAAARFISEQLTSSDPVAVFSVSRSAGVVMCTNFTTDHRRLVEALWSLGSKKSSEVRSQSAGLVESPISPLGMRQRTGPSLGAPGATAEGIEDSLSGLEPEYQVALHQFDRRTYRSVVESYLSDLRDLARGLDALPGRKFVVLFSGGFDIGKAFFNTSEPVVSAESGNGLDMDLMDATEGKFERQTADLASAAMSYFSTSDCRLYLIDSAGLPAPGDPGTAKRQASLSYMASEAGGKLYQNINALDKPLAEIKRETQHYYLLAYTPPPGKGGGAFHKIKVEVSRPGLSISYRKGYYEPKSFAAYTAFEKDLQIAEIVNKDVSLEQLRFDAQAYCFPTFSAEWSSFATVVTEIAIPGAMFQGTRNKSVELYGFAVGSDGTIADFFHATPDLKRADLGERLGRGGLIYSDMLLLPPGGYELKLIVRNTETGAVGTSDLPLTVEDFSRAGLHMATPCFLSAGNDSVKIRGTDRGARSQRFKDAQAAYPVTIEKEEFVPAACPTLRKGAGAAVLLKLCNITVDPDSGEPSYRVSWAITDSSAKPEGSPKFTVDRSVLEAGGHAGLLFTVEIPELGPGLHVLHTTVFDKVAGTSASESVAFRVE